ncbi:hypothetical protein BDY24DRAFT_387297 [Mrakia frigida]|uniref:uncharacterized protein n=1 Tax=Mrakia frigida TaxID=29902 RepID=UPI003FCC2714
MEAGPSSHSSASSSTSFPPPPSAEVDRPPSPGKAPKGLKKGSACLHCRKRKLRCSGDRPVCGGCQKNRIECVYDDPARPRGRMKLLEEKIATLESILTRDTGGATSFKDIPANLFESSEVDTSFPYPQQHRSSSSLANKNPSLSAQESFSIALEGLFRSEGAVGGEYDGGPATGEGGNASNWFGFDPTRPAAFDFLNQTPTALPPFDTSNQVGRQPWEFNPSAFVPQPPTSQQPSLSSPPSMFQASANNNFNLYNPVPPSFNFPTSQPNIAYPTTPISYSSSSIVNEDVGLQGFSSPTFTLGDDANLSLDLRSHLLQLFFERRRQFVLVLDASRFLSSLDGPSDRRPSQALVFAMCAAASGFSPVEEVRRLDRRFIELSRRFIDLSIRDDKAGLLQVLQASSLLATLFYSRGCYSEGWVQSGVSLRIVGMCSLHRIPTSNINLYTTSAHRSGSLGGVPTLRRKTYTRLDPPRDGTELGEQIGAFWTAFTIDRVGSAEAGWPEGIANELVSTPLPLPLEDYENDLSSHVDQHFSDLFSLEPIPQNRQPAGVGATFLQAVALHHRVALLREHPDLQLPSTSSSFDSSPESDSPSTPKPIPEVLLQTERILRRFVDSLPPSSSILRVPGGIPPWNTPKLAVPFDSGNVDSVYGDGSTMGIHPVVFSTNTTLYSCFVLLYEEMSHFDSSYNEKAVSAGCLAVSMISHIVDVNFGELDVILAVFWRTIARFLLGEAKRLRRAGFDEEASLREVDVEVLLLSMRRMGEVWAVADSQASAIEALQKLNLSDGDDGNDASG